MKFKKIVILYILFGIPYIFFSALVDTTQFGVYTFFNYLSICLWEYFIFGLGILAYYLIDYYTKPRGLKW